MLDLPDPTAEIRLVALTSLHGANYWSSRPVTRVDVAVGAFDHISSADVSGFTDALVGALPGLHEHRCSVGRPGGFIVRLRRGTYAPHVMEHVALELQEMIGHRVGYGRARGGDRPGEYTVTFEHLHSAVGLRAAALALQVVQAAFAGRFESVDAAVAELKALAALPEPHPLPQHVTCGIVGGGDRAAVRESLLRRGIAEEDLIIDVSPAYLLNAGLPYASSDVAVILDAQPVDVPERYRDPARARRLHGVLADGVPEGGYVVVPAGDPELIRVVEDAGRMAAVFGAEISRREAAALAATEERGRIVILERGRTVATERTQGHLPIDSQLAAALAVSARERMAGRVGR
jgi:hypothetical protein